MISSAVTLHHSGCVDDMCFIIICLFIQNTLALKEAIVFLQSGGPVFSGSVASLPSCLWIGSGAGGDRVWRV